MTAPKRRSFRWSLRTLFAVVTVCAMLGGWLASVHQLVQERRALWNAMNEDYSLRVVGLWPADEQQDIPLIRKIMGDFPCNSLMYSPERDKDGRELKRVRLLFPEARIWGWPMAVGLPEGIEPLEPGRRWMM